MKTASCGLEKGGSTDPPSQTFADHQDEDQRTAEEQHHDANFTSESDNDSGDSDCLSYELSGPGDVSEPYRMALEDNQHTGTVASTTRTSTTTTMLPVFAEGKSYPPPLPDKEAYVVGFSGPDDPLHPHNWKLAKKILGGAMLGWTTFNASFASSVFAPDISVIAKNYHVSSEVGTLGISLFVAGFATGPILWGPLSELKGRRFSILLGMFGFTIFQFAVATAQNLQTVLICRFFGGFFGACPLSVVPAYFSDIFNVYHRGIGITIFTMMVFNGPLFAPIMGGFVVDSYLGWRWTEYLSGIMSASAFVLDFLFMDETYAPVILIDKAAELRRLTKNWGIHARQEDIEVDFRALVKKNFGRPLVMLVKEPILLLISLYMAFIYGLLYLFMDAYPVIFEKVYGFNKGLGSLPYIGVIVGETIGGIFCVLLAPGFNKKLKMNNETAIPEWRLPPVIVGGVAFSAGLFWLGWTGFTKSIHWIAATLSGLLTGFGLLVIFLQGLNYIVDVYLPFAASAIAANSIVRSLAGAGFPMFGTIMFENLGVNWSGTLLGCVAAVLVPIPVIFYLYGDRIRRLSSYTS